ncbi:hypothetical protein A0H76_3005 [Hepatospora eriocheir]|uniref:Uncharacterized protein n=1 Tax=Hepatospora eriocheir TaxID=1081669 RepID=A0A1X0QL41_9MICR|nr:hypothetical protein A0H76_3005 [Hepatospora eriocheir]
MLILLLIITGTLALRYTSSGAYISVPLEVALGSQISSLKGLYFTGLDIKIKGKQKFIY